MATKTYTINHTCPNCQGQKKIRKQTLEHPEGEDVNCPVCNGTGTIVAGTMVEN